jgi:hypothetical protein
MRERAGSTHEGELEDWFGSTEFCKYVGTNVSSIPSCNFQEVLR